MNKVFSEYVFIYHQLFHPWLVSIMIKNLILPGTQVQAPCSASLKIIRTEWPTKRKETLKHERKKVEIRPGYLPNTKSRHVCLPLKYTGLVQNRRFKNLINRMLTHSRRVTVTYILAFRDWSVSCVEGKYLSCHLQGVIFTEMLNTNKRRGWTPEFEVTH